MSKKIDVIGLKFNRLTVLSEDKEKIYPGGQKGSRLICKCDCGKIKSVLKGHIRSGKTKSCGCLTGEKARERLLKHGLKNHFLYNTWNGIKQRCHNKKSKQYKYYGERGIKFCDEWKNNPSIFFDWCINNGYQKGLDLDRIDNDGNYEPDNCRFISHRKNCLNQKLLRSDNKLGYRGISFHDNKYRSMITILNQGIIMGHFFTLKAAIEARNKYIIKNDLEEEYKIQKYRG